MTYVYECNPEGGGSFMDWIVGESLESKTLVCLNPFGKWVKTNKLNIVDKPLLGISIGKIFGGKKGRIFLNGFIGNQNWRFTPNKNLFIGDEDGSISQIDYYNTSYRVGVAFTVNVIYFNPMVLPPNK
jgi:hypothetical protein